MFTEKENLVSENVSLVCCVYNDTILHWKKIQEFQVSEQVEWLESSKSTLN